MMYALTQDGARIRARRGVRAWCPICSTQVIGRCGTIVAHHWAHVGHAECDLWAERDSAWHRAWQQAVPPERREVVIGQHRADIVGPDGIVVELQHSPISPAAIAEREALYQRMLWLFDATDPYRRGRLDIRLRRGSSGMRYITFRWKHPRKSVAVCCMPVLLDLGNGSLLLLRKIYISGMTGGWGYLQQAETVRAWLRRSGGRAAA